MRLLPNFKGMDFFPHDLRLPFMRYKGLAVGLSIVGMALALLIMAVKGFNYGVDFKGGSMLEMQSNSGPADVGALRERLGARSVVLVARFIGTGGFDAMEEFARVFPVEVFADEVGVPEESREYLLPYGDMVFNGQGPRNEYFREAMKNAAEVQEWIMSSCRRENLAPGGFGARISEAADAGEITEAQAGMLVRSFLSAGLSARRPGSGRSRTRSGRCSGCRRRV